MRTVGEGRVLVLLSGGVDSTLCARMMRGRGDAVSALFVDYGQAPSNRERKAASDVAAELKIQLDMVEIAGLGHPSQGEQFGRNSLLISTAAFALRGQSSEIVIGVHAGTGYYDCSPRFVSMMDNLLREQSDGLVGVSAPLLDWSKQEVYQAFGQSGVPVELTYSCENAAMPCGACRSCLDRTALEC